MAVSRMDLHLVLPGLKYQISLANGSVIGLVFGVYLPSMVSMTTGQVDTVVASQQQAT